MDQLGQDYHYEPAPGDVDHPGARPGLLPHPVKSQNLKPPEPKSNP